MIAADNPRKRLIRLGQILKIFMEREKVSTTWLSVPSGDGGNPSPLGEEKFIYCRYATLPTGSTYQERS